MDGLLVPCIYCVQAFHSNYYRLGKLPYGIPVHVRQGAVEIVSSCSYFSVKRVNLFSD